MKKTENTNNTCKSCFQIKCKQCDWIATEENVLKIQQGELTACPYCGWKPDKS